eukprot:EG_transcript_5296
MCGILAILGIAGGADSFRHRALKLSRMMRHRGPDWNGIYCEGNNILCHERLAIVGVDDGAQPLYNHSKSIIMSVNGEIYNHVQLRAELPGNHVWMTHSDCEVLLHAYAQYGPEFLKKIHVNGMFAFVLYDSDKDVYIAARDPIGIIPLYYGHGRDGSVWFSSEMKGLQDNCATFQPLPPGHIYNSVNHAVEPWYSAEWQNMNIIPSRKIGLQELREAFEAAVVRHMMAETPCGVLLSGGLDSSLVAAIAARYQSRRAGETQEADFPRLHSFCIGLKGSPDLKAAEDVAALIHTKHHSYNFTIQEGLDALSEVIWHLETYDVTTIRASTPMFLMSRKIKASGVKMVLSGEGSDEIFGGYLYFHKAPNKEEFHKELVRKVSALHLYDCARANKSTMAFGLEARVPFLDREFLELCMAFDPAQKMCVDEKGDKRIEKWILRAAFDTSVDRESTPKRAKTENGADPYLPASVLWRQKEQFSDGVGYGWIDALRDNAEQKVTDEQLAQARFVFPHNTPATKEAYYYRQIFASHFPSDAAAKTVPGGPSVACSTAAAIEWDASFKNRADPSGRAVAGVHNQAY